jgi:hypothetical protein
MSFLKTSLEKRIKELRTSIEAQNTELAAYEQVLALESGKPVAGLAAAPATVAAVVKHHTSTHSTPVHQKTAQKKTVPQILAAAPASAAPITVEFNGSRSDFVASVLKQRGAAGIAPAEISAAFASRKIAVSKNLVYNVLSLMFKQKRVRKSGGKYYPIAGKAPAPPAVSAPAPSSPETKKRRISEEGMRRIIAATKKRWALARAAKTKGR